MIPKGNASWLEQRFHFRIKRFRDNSYCHSVSHFTSSLPLYLRKWDGSPKGRGTEPDALPVCYKDPFQPDLPSGGVSQEAEHTKKPGLLCATHRQHSEWDLHHSVGGCYKMYGHQSFPSIRLGTGTPNWRYTSKPTELLGARLFFRRNVTSTSCKHTSLSILIYSLGEKSQGVEN